MAATPMAPVIAIDGPTASGKGTVATRIARQLGWHMLDSGAIYRLAALAVLKADIDPQAQTQVLDVIRLLDIRFSEGRVWLSNEDVTQEIRHEAVGDLASRLAPDEQLREALLARQRAFRQGPGLVADGRDMGTVVFPDAPLKIYLQADVQARAQRRHKQLQQKGERVAFETVLQDLRDRDDRDMNRSVAPLRAADDAHIVDSSAMSIEETVERILALWQTAGA